MTLEGSLHECEHI